MKLDLTEYAIYLHGKRTFAVKRTSSDNLELTSLDAQKVVQQSNGEFETLGDVIIPFDRTEITEQKTIFMGYGNTQQNFNV